MKSIQFAQKRCGSFGMPLMPRNSKAKDKVQRNGRERFSILLAGHLIHLPNRFEPIIPAASNPKPYYPQYQTARMPHLLLVLYDSYPVQLLILWLLQWILKFLLDPHYVITWERPWEWCYGLLRSWRVFRFNSLACIQSKCQMCCDRGTA